MWRKIDAILLPRVDQGHLNRLILFTIIISLSAFLVLTGRLMMVIILIILAWSIWFTYRWPIFLAGIAMLLSIEFFRLVPLKGLIKLQLAPGLRFNMLDAIVLFSLPLAIFRLMKYKEKPLFVGSISLILGVAFLSLGIGLAFGTTNLDYGMELLRTVFYYTAYFILISAINSPRRLKQWIGFLSAIFLISVFIQFIEAVLGQRLTLGLGDLYGYSTGSRIIVGGYQVMYLWNRAGFLAFLVLFLGLGALFEGRKQKWFWFISAMGVGSILLAFVRQWYVYLSIGILALLILQAKSRFRNLILVVLIILFLFGLFMVISPVLQNSYGPSFLQAWFLRLDSLIHFQRASSFITRMHIIEKQWEMFLRSPLIGYGLSPVFKAEFSWDTGITNTLVQFGLLGLGAVLVLIVSFLRHAFRLRQQLAPSIQKGYVSGLIAIWICVLIGSLFGMNYFTGRNEIWMMVNVLALLDRFYVYAPRWNI